MIAIDEAHCVLSYGFDFRPKYRDIESIRVIIPDVPVYIIAINIKYLKLQNIQRILLR